MSDTPGVARSTDILVSWGDSDVNKAVFVALFALAVVIFFMEARR